MNRQQDESLEDAAKKEGSYPSFDLEACIKFSEHVKTLGGSKNPVKKSLLAQQVQLAESTPGFFQRISSSKVFGIITGWGTYKLTDLGQAYFYPVREQDERAAALTILGTPPAFAFIIKRLDGEKLPTNEMIGNILHQELGIPDSWKDRVASLFIRSARYLGIIDDAGYLRYDAAMQNLKSTAGASGDTDPTKITVPQPAERPAIDALNTPGLPPLSVTRPAPQTTVWAFSGLGKSIRLETPEDMPSDLWEKLNKYVQILKPEKAQESKE
jgi:hypothetical protein